MHPASRDGEQLEDEPFLVLNAIYLCKMATPEHVARVTGLPAQHVQTVFADAAADELLVDLGGQAMLSDLGRERVLAYYRARYAEARAGATVLEWYGRFEAVNTQFIKLVTEWQKTDGDERVQERLLRLVERHITALGELTAEIPRYATYAARFEHGLAKIDEGRSEFVCKPTVDSIHNVWFEFHEDILAVIGRPRET